MAQPVQNKEAEVGREIYKICEMACLNLSMATTALIHGDCVGQRNPDFAAPHLGFGFLIFLAINQSRVLLSSQSAAQIPGQMYSPLSSKRARSIFF